MTSEYLREMDGGGYSGTSIFPVGMAMCTHAIEHYEGVFQSSLLLYTGKKG